MLTLRQAVLALAVVSGLTAVSPGLADPPALRIGVQKYGALVIVEARKTLEQRLQGQVSSIQWIEFPAGPQLLEAMAAGSIDFGTTGESPPVFAQAGGKRFVYVGVEGAAPLGEAILVRKDSPLRSAADLKGRKIAFNRGANVHYLLVRALQAAGLGPADIEPVYLAPADARAAFATGSVDAWAIWDPYLSAAEAAGDSRELLNGTGLVANHEFYLADPDYARAHPAIVTAILNEIDSTDRWTAGHIDEAALQLASNTGLPVPVLKQALSRLPFIVSPVDPDIVEAQQKIADSFHELGLIPRAITVRDDVWTRP